MPTDRAKRLIIEKASGAKEVAASGLHRVHQHAEADGAIQSQLPGLLARFWEQNVFKPQESASLHERNRLIRSAYEVL